MPKGKRKDGVAVVTYGPQTTRVMISFPVPALEDLDMLSVANVLSRSEQVRRLVSDELARLQERAIWQQRLRDAGLVVEIEGVGTV